MPEDPPSRMSAQELYDLYLKEGSVHRAGERLGLCGETIRKRLKTAGYTLNGSRFTSDQDSAIRSAYATGMPFKIQELEKQLGRSYHAIACRAGLLGVSARRGKYIRPHLRQEPKAKMTGEERSAMMKDRHRNFPHPMLGRRWTPEERLAISARNKGRKVHPETLLKIMKTKMEKYGSLVLTKRGNWKSGWRVIGPQKIYARSTWEANYARYLELLRNEGTISKWEHEPVTFWFARSRSGPRCYIPDFRVTFPSGKIQFHEVKRWMDARSRIKLVRMEKYHPKIKIVLVQLEWFSKHHKNLQNRIPEWEQGKLS